VQGKVRYLYFISFFGCGVYFVINIFSMSASRNGVYWWMFRPVVFFAILLTLYIRKYDKIYMNKSLPLRLLCLFAFIPAAFLYIFYYKYV